MVDDSDQALSLQLRLAQGLAGLLKELDPARRQDVVDLVFSIAGPDFSRFQQILSAATAFDSQRHLALLEYLRRHVAINGGALSPDQAAAACDHFLGLPADYIAQLSATLPAPMPGPVQSVGQSLADASFRREQTFRLWPSKSQILGELAKGGSIMTASAIAYAAWSASDSIPLGGAILFVMVIGILFFFGRRKPPAR